ncbi:MAG TPA: DUF4235 domain-containing protein [Actinomycetes bacterium]|jgi:predicted metal-dependent enzyme (double-stranded beta helix superfamily)|nr:DUF4235 domain-containing protein [Actinomycetes bacterium]
MTKLLYRPLGLGFSVAGGLLAGMLFKQVWKLLAGEEDAPKATDEDRRWREILVAAALQGAVFAVVKAVVDRSGAKGVRRLTGTWPAG